MALGLPFPRRKVIGVSGQAGGLDFLHSVKEDEGQLVGNDGKGGQPLGPYSRQLAVNDHHTSYSPQVTICD